LLLRQSTRILGFVNFSQEWFALLRTKAYGLAVEPGVQLESRLLGLQRVVQPVGEPADLGVDDRLVLEAIEPEHLDVGEVDGTLHAPEAALHGVVRVPAASLASDEVRDEGPVFRAGGGGSDSDNAGPRGWEGEHDGMWRRGWPTPAASEAAQPGIDEDLILFFCKSTV
jgi:hypothetical protein